MKWSIFPILPTPKGWQGSIWARYSFFKCTTFIILSDIRSLLWIEMIRMSYLTLSDNSHIFPLSNEIIHLLTHTICCWNISQLSYQKVGSIMSLKTLLLIQRSGKMISIMIPCWFNGDVFPSVAHHLYFSYSGRHGQLPSFMSAGLLMGCNFHCSLVIEIL